MLLVVDDKFQAATRNKQNISRFLSIIPDTCSMSLAITREALRKAWRKRPPISGLCFHREADVKVTGAAVLLTVDVEMELCSASPDTASTTKGQGQTSLSQAAA